RPTPRRSGRCRRIECSSYASLWPGSALFQERRQLFKHPLRGQASGFGRNQATKTDRLNQVPPWEFRNRRKSFTPRQLARILWDFAYLCWANTYIETLQRQAAPPTVKQHMAAIRML